MYRMYVCLYVHICVRIATQYSNKTPSVFITVSVVVAVPLHTRRVPLVTPSGRHTAQSRSSFQMCSSKRFEIDADYSTMECTAM